MSDLRHLQFKTLDEAVDEVQLLLEHGYEQQGKWNLAQMCRHLYLVQDASVDGYAKWMSAFAFLRPVMRKLLLTRVLRGDSPKGIRTLPAFVPKDEGDSEDEAVKFHQSVERFKNHQGAYAPHPAFGRMDRKEFEAVHAAHAAHHLRFLVPHESPGQEE